MLHAITPLGYIVIFFSVLFFFYKAEKLLMLAIFLSVFQDVSIMSFNLSGRDIYPINVFYLPALLFILKVLFEKFNKNTISKCVRLWAPLALIDAWGILSAFTLPFAFAGLMVIPTRPPVSGQLMEMLHFTFSNITQSVYLSFYVFFTLAVCANSAKNPTIIDKAIKVFFFGFAILVMFSIWELLSYYCGFYYPADLIHSEIRGIDFSVWREQHINSIIRISALFREPSYFSYYLTGTLSCFISYAIKTKSFSLISKVNLLALVIGTVLLMILTTSTTAILGIVSVALFFVCYCLYHQHSKNSFLVVVSSIVILLVLSIGLIIATNIFPAWDNTNFINSIRDVTINKINTNSYQSRSSGFANAAETFFKTYGLGVGLGSTRPFSLIGSIMENLGILGLILFYMLISSVLRATTIIKKLYRSKFGADNKLYDKSLILSGSLIGYLIAGAISNPDITFPYPWINMGLLFGLAANILAQQQQTPNKQFRA